MEQIVYAFLHYPVSLKVYFWDALSTMLFL